MPTALRPAGTTTLPTTSAVRGRWLTATTASGSSPENNANKAFNKARQDYFDFIGWTNDWNNMIGDVSSAFSRYGEDNIKSYFHTISNYSGAFSCGSVFRFCK